MSRFFTGRSALWLIAASVAAIVIGAAVAMLVREPIQRTLASKSARSDFGHNKLNVLILGYQDDEATTDTIILAHLDVDRRTATLVSIPRDAWVPIPGNGSAKINAAYAYGGAKMSSKVVSTLLGGIPIDATIALQPDGAASIVDAMGGLNVNVDEDMDYDDASGELHIHLKKGPQFLNGSQVLGYIRFRHDGASDFGRVRRQQQVVKVMMDQLSQIQNWVKLPHIIASARKNVATSLSDRKLVTLLQVYRDVPDENVRSFTLPSKVGWVGDASVVFVDQRWATLIGKLLFERNDPPQDAVLVANATGSPDVDATIVGAMRGGGWNVPSFLDQPRRARSVTVGSTPAALLLSHAFATAIRPGISNTLVIGSDNAPETQ
jgi:polyisoprenyl-teichoic acid--peptidoglycan teichoic acid transferase